MSPDATRVLGVGLSTPSHAAPRCSHGRRKVLGRGVEVLSRGVEVLARGVEVLWRGVELLARATKVRCVPVAARHAFLEHEFPDVLAWVGQLRNARSRRHGAAR